MKCNFLLEKMMIAFVLLLCLPCVLWAEPTNKVGMSKFAIYKKMLSAKVLAYPLETVKAGGMGGNEKTGIIYYDGLIGENHRSALIIQRDPVAKVCYLQNENVVVRDWQHDLDVVQFPCDKPDATREGIYWNPNFDLTNGAYNPGNDALYAAQVASKMYQQWYHQTQVWKLDDKPLKIVLIIHNENDYSYLDRYAELLFASFNDGDQDTYPLSSSFDIVVSAIGQGYALATSGFYATYPHDGFGSAIPLSFYNIWAKAAEYYVTGHNTWLFGNEIPKQNNKSLLYLDNPTRDCDGRKPGDNCSIDHVTQYDPNKQLETEYKTGIMNKAFYLIATSPSWNTKKAFEVFKLAYDNGYYNEEYNTAACGIKKAAKDLNYDTQVIVSAFLTVGVNIPNDC